MEKVPVYSAVLFDWQPKIRSFAADMSELENHNRTILDHGEFDIFNPKTKGRARFVLSKTLKDREGDVAYWLFENAQYKLKAFVYND